ncbi:protein bli-3 [Metarhizium album ARSEF 1941]|uniref:Protein bli-3 n=1 Tax=Metarhizium album (strain ARSEF 1941) TaxID=1081103 RepID=A0A0B2WT44_METAS|nr:protein bli-3 [Metarhizium album ARSEF 1941]KHN96140.1 protein bli-3 [Metarhizium album ARSEF 1941]
MSFSNTSTGDKPADPYSQANKEEVDVRTKVTDLGNFVTKCKYGMMTTRSAGSDRLVSRCMALAGTVNNGADLIFFTNTESGKTDDVAGDPHANMAFLNAAGEWASVSGRASIITDRDAIKKYYSPVLKAWLGDLGDGVHDASENDPRIGIVKIAAETATYALSAKGQIMQAVEVAQSTLTGKPAVVNSLRHVSEEEFKAWREHQV